MRYLFTNKRGFAAALLFTAFSVLAVSAVTGCNNNTKAQNNEIDFTESYSGSFVTASTLTDSNDDGKPANLGEFEGTSTFGPVSIQSLNEFEKADTNDNCPPGELEFSLVRGNFVKRISNGDLLYGTWATGTSCFDPVTAFSTTFQIGVFTGGTSQFITAAGPIRIDYESTFLVVPSVSGFDFGGSSGTGEGTIELN